MSELMSKIQKPVVAEKRLLEFTASACLSIQQVTHAKAAHSNFRNQLKRGNFEIVSSTIPKIFILTICTMLFSACSVFRQDIVHYKNYSKDSGRYEDCEGYYQNGEFIKHGLCRYYAPAIDRKANKISYDAKVLEGNYVNGIRQGTFIEWYANGPKSSECNYNSQGEPDGKEIVYDTTSEKNKEDIIRYWKNGKPWEGKFYVREKVMDEKYFDTYFRQRHALLIYKDGKLISNSNPSIQNYYIIYEDKHCEITRGDVEGLKPPQKEMK